MREVYRNARANAGVVGLAVLIASIAAARELAVSHQPAPPPSELADAIEAVLQTGGPRVAGPATLDFWWVKTLPLKPDTTELSWEVVDEGTLVGAVRVSNAFVDARRDRIAPGIYTLRYARQPADARPGVSHFVPVLLLSPVARDESASAMSVDDAVALAREASGALRPAAWRIDPPVAVSAPLSTFTSAEGSTGVVFDIPASRDGRDVGTLRFGLILTGR